MKAVVVLGIVVAVEVLEVVAVMVVVMITKPLRSNLELFKAMSDGVLFVLPMKL
jgi:hypothetical protein